jgi:hypothetical protein
MKVIKSLAVAAIALVVALVVAGPASAVAAKFHSATGSVANNGALVVSFDERGLGNETINYLLTADATALYACINGGGKHPQAANKESFEDQVSGGTSADPKNGRVVADITAGPLLAPTFQCPRGQGRVLAAVTYTNIVLTDVTNGTWVSVPDVSRTFFDV